MLITDYELCNDEQHKEAMLEQVNDKRSDLNEGTITGHGFYQAEFNNGYSFKVLECYPNGEVPFLFTTLLNADKATLEKIETYTGLKFKYVS